MEGRASLAGARVVRLMPGEDARRSIFRLGWRLGSRDSASQDFRGYVYGKIYGSGNEAQMVGVLVEGQGFGSIIAGGNLYYGFEQHADELAGTVVILRHCS